MDKRFGLLASRRELLKSGAAALGLGVMGIPASRLLAADLAVPPRPDIASPAGQAMAAIYEAAVGKMKDPAINKVPSPFSWTFQAYIHALPVDPMDPNSDGYANGSPEFIAKIDEIYGKAPTGEVALWKKAALACWSTCPHGSVYFLPWHRWYMFYFEQVIRSVSGRPDFSLPYWAYGSNAGNSLQLPAAFQNPSSPLFETIRGLGFANPVNLGPQTVPMNQNGYMAYKLVDYNPSLVANPYFPADVGSTLYFPPQPGWFAYGYTGRTETQPHDNVHDGVGGLMGNVPTAAHDAVFFMHHCQIDHLWAGWQSYAGIDMNFAPPGKGSSGQATKAEWEKTQFAFVDGKGKLISVTPQGAMDYKALGYSYDSLAPRPAPSAQVAQALSPQVMMAHMAETSSLDSKEVVAVGAGGTTLSLSPIPKGRADLMAAQTLAKTLNLRNVTLEKRPPAPLYIFVNLPAGADADIEGPYFLGALSLFKLKAAKGLASTSKQDSQEATHGPHSGHGMTAVNFSFDISKLLEAQREKGQWQGGEINVTISTAGVKDVGGGNYLTIGSVELAK